jgi:hypothetical protein
MTFYDKIKVSFYSTVLTATILSINAYGLSGHTMPIGFIIPVLGAFSGIIWLIVDWVLEKVYLRNQMN